jgi:hypothetical protein
MGRSSYVRGNRFMLHVSRLLSTWWCDTPADAPASGLPFRARSTSIVPIVGHWEGAGDILHRPDLPFAFPFAVECKDSEEGHLDAVLEAPNWPVWEWWDQAQKQAATVRLWPMLVFSRRHRDTYVMLNRSTSDRIGLVPGARPVLEIACPGIRPVTVCVWRDLTQLGPEMVAGRKRHG